MLFIADIDDRLPSLLGYDERDIIENYLIGQALAEFDDLILSEGKENPDCFSGKKLRSNDATRIGVDFQDCYLTSDEEGPSQSDCGRLFQPYQIVVPRGSGGQKRGSGRPERGYQINPSHFVTEHCLIRKLTWKYTESTDSTKYSNS